MKKQKILLSAIAAGMLFSAGLADDGLNWEYVLGSGWQDCLGGCNSDNQNAGLWSETADANDQSVTIDTEHGGDVYGGYSEATSGNANGNTVALDTGASARKVYGGYSHYNGNGNANENTVILNNGVVINGNVYGGESANGATNENVVVIDSENINSSTIYGGSARTEAKDNVVVYKSGTLSNTHIFGGYGGTSSGNQLIIAGKDLEAKSLNYFQEYFFALPVGISKGDTMLTLGDKLTLKDKDKIGVGAQGELKNLNTGDKVTLIDGVAPDSFKNIKDENKNLEAKDFLSDRLLKVGYKGLTVEYNYDFELNQEGNKLNATLLNGEASATEESKSPAEGSSAAMANLNSAGDTVAGKATESAVANANTGLGAGMSVNNFGAIGAGSNRYKTGSYVDSKSFNIVVGVGLGKELDFGKLVVGPFLEFGYSDYETHNDFGSGHVKGDGKSKYYGFGALARVDLNDHSLGAHEAHPYFELSARFGRNKNEFSNDTGADYDVSANYWGAHFGLGYIIKAGASSFDVYGKYFFTRLNSSSATLKDGSNFSFDAVKSSKTLLGARYLHDMELANGMKVSPYIGAGWQKEFKGDSKAAANGLGVEAPSLKGNSAMAEIGVKLGKEKGLKADIGLAGYAGKQRGINGNLILMYEF